MDKKSCPKDAKSRVFATGQTHHKLDAADLLRDCC
jgi:hypothetical protein